jgi:UDP-N-acetylglucosamine:LPS N-acetylglucosamine transferase
LKESEIAADVLAQMIRKFATDPERLRQMSQQSSMLMPKNAAALVVETMERYTSHDARV